MTLQELLELRNSKIKDAQKLYDSAKAEARGLSDDENGKVDALLLDAETLSDQIKTAEESEKADQQRKDRLANALSELSKPQPRKVSVEVGKPIALSDPKGGMKGFAEFCLNVIADGVGNDVSDSYRNWKRVSMQAAAETGLQTDLTGKGGALIPSGYTTMLLEKVYADNPFLAQVTRVPLTQGNTIPIPYINESSRADGSRDGGVRVYRDYELKQLTESSPSFGVFNLKLKALTGFLGVSDEMMKWSAISLEPLFTQMFVRGFSFKNMDEIVNGDGSAGQMTGVLNAPCAVSQSKETGQAAATIVWNNVVNMYSRRHVGSGPYMWLINQNCLPQLASMSLAVGTGGVPVWMPAGGVSGQLYSSLLGIPVVETEQCQTLGTVGDIILASPSSYVLAEAPGIESASSIHLHFDYRQTCFRWVIFNDGAPWWSSALTPFKGGSSFTQSPFIKLATRS